MNKKPAGTAIKTLTKVWKSANGPYALSSNTGKQLHQIEWYVYKNTFGNTIVR